MMVIFVSQCEKRALARTRRVLDAFADRIGDNTWQTIITQEGLNAVKKLLRKTASKSTAVSCHWIRSRSRSELIWIVGRRQAFNYRGIVPVNFTTKEVIMDQLPIETGQLLANTQGQMLSKHLFAVGYVAVKILDSLHVGNKNLNQAAFIAGVFHDLGKIDPEFQNWLSKKNGKSLESFVPDDGVHIDSPSKFSFEKHPRHHELSWVFAEALLENSSLNKEQRKQIAHAIYWHHTKPFRKDDKFTSPEAIYQIFTKSLEKTSFLDVFRKVLTVINDVGYLSEVFEIKGFFPSLNDSFTLIDEKGCPDYKKYDEWADELHEFQKNVRENALNNLVRTSVISADRLVSRLSSEELDEYLAENSLYELADLTVTQDKSSLCDEIRRCLDGFDKIYPDSKRNEAQSIAAQSLAKLKLIAKINEATNIGVLQGPAGCGKTKIALEWALKTNTQKIIWICPRVQVCLGLLHDLTTEDYLPNSTIEIFTGEYKKILRDGMNINGSSDTDERDYFSGDIVITTIDQVVNSIRSHSHVDTFVQFMNAHVVFDEFHELINMPAFNLLFAELIEAKKQQGEYANTLLVSATPHYFYLTQFLGIPIEDIVTIDSFNSSNYQIEFKNYDEKEDISPLIKDSQKEGTFVITNTALDAQLGFIQNHSLENSILLHSKYTNQDKTYWFDMVFNSFKRNGNRQYDILRSGPIVQASLNITCDKMLTEITCAENWLQRLGRLDRFGENSSVNEYITVIPESISTYGKQTSNCARFLNQMCVWNSTKAWLSFIQDKLSSQNIVMIDELYRIYKDFYEDAQSQEPLKRDFTLALKKSVALINEKIIDPISVPPKSKLKPGVMKMSANSLRGDNRFVQMAVCEISEDQKINFTDSYAYNEVHETNQPMGALTDSIEAMRGYGNDDDNLVQFMQKKHHNIKPEQRAKKARNEWELIKESRSPEAPIYLSYTPKDLEIVNSKPHPQAIYYVITSRQPVGAMSIAKLTKKFNQK